MNSNTTEASWDRRKGESAKAYAAFCAYRDYGINRSLTKVIQRYNGKYGSRTLLAKWSTLHDWVRRCYEYDVFMEKERRRELNSYYIKMLKRHAEQAKLIQEKALKALQKVDPETLTNQELLKYLEIGMKIERETLCLPIEIDNPQESNNNFTEAKISKEIMEKTEALLNLRKE